MSCVEMHKLGLWDGQCCSSCHYDSDDLDMEMCHVTVEGKEYEVCCACAIAVKGD